MTRLTFTATDPRGLMTSASCWYDPFRLDVDRPTSFTGLNVLGLTTDDLTVVNGDLIVTATSPVSLDRLWVKGHVRFTSNVARTMSNSVIQGRPFPTAGNPPLTSIVYARSTATPAAAVLNLTNCEVRCVQPDVNLVCANGERLGKLTRCSFRDGSDLVNYWGSRAWMEGCHVGPFTFWANDPKHTNDAAHPGWSHNDGIQSNGCANGIVRGCIFDMRANPAYGDYATLAATFPGGRWGTAVMLSPSTGVFTNFKIQKNWFGYGQAPVALPFQSGGSFNTGHSWDVSGNRFFALPDPYGTNDHQLVRWGYEMGPLPASVHDNVFDNDPALRVGLRGTALAPAIVYGTPGPSAQYSVRTSG
jgi:hypothetical protein